MKRILLCVRQIAAMSAALALFTSPIAVAQTPALASPTDGSAATVVLNSAAFARLVKVRRPDAGPVPDVTDLNNVTDSPRLKGLPHGPTPRTTRLAEASVAPTLLRRRSPKTRTLAVLAVVGAIAGAFAISYYWGVDVDPVEVLNGLSGGAK